MSGAKDGGPAEAITDLDAIVGEINRRFAAREAQPAGGFYYLPLMKALRCADGFGVSVQASQSHYCLPRADFGPYYEVECGFPTQPMPTLGQWIEEGDPAVTTETVWGYVPIREVAAVLASHGGLLPVRAERGA